MGFASDLLQMSIGQGFQTPFLPSTDLTGQTVVITGGNTGLGFEAAKHIYKLNVSHLILACRSTTKGETARTKILASDRTMSPGNVEVWEMDMSKYTSIIAFGERMKKLPKLDVFIANAGIDAAQFEVFEGHESNLTVNVISTLLVAMLAVPKLRETSSMQRKPTRLIFTGSVVHIFAKSKYLSKPGPGQILASLDDESTADMNDRYNLSKLVLLLGVRQLATELESSSDKAQLITVNFVNPGWCKTELFRTNDGGMGGRIGLRLVGRTAEEGSRTLVYSAVAGEGTHGKYMSECRVKPESSWARSAEGTNVQKRLWKELVETLEAILPGVTRL